MKIIKITFLFLLIGFFCQAQPNFTQNTVDGSYNGATSVFAIDLDQDGDMDILGTADVDKDLTWWENDGSQNFTTHTIDGNYNGAYDVFAIDMDDDGDIDILSVGYNDDDVTWWENDGSENFTEHTIDGSYDGAISIFAIDIDSDGDIDVLATSYSDDDLHWWENDGSENFTKRAIDTNYDGAYEVFAIDLDEDGDIDILSTAYNDDDITWWENDGSENFTEHTIDGSYNGARGVYAIDLDEDGDIDVLGTAYNDDDITWWENNGSESFTQHTIEGNYDGATAIYPADLDCDGDIDLVTAGYNEDDITWWENDGSENFTERTIIGNFNGASNVYVADIDSDDFFDVLGTAYLDDDITWWENDLTGSGCATDSDNDGIVDADDLDDDNDGILDEDECNVASITFLNGGFESPVMTVTTWTLVHESSVPGWETTAADGLIEFWNSGFNGVPSQEGSQFVELNANVVSTLFQTFTINGLGGTVDWSLYHRGRSGVEVANVLMGETLGTATIQQVMSDGTGSWGFYSGTYNIPVGITTLVIAFESTSGGSLGNFLDDVQVTLDQPCLDTDGDSITNELDTDSDDDGCQDAIEGAGSFTSADLNANEELSGSVDSNGIPTLASGGQATTSDVTDAGTTSQCSSSCETIKINRHISTQVLRE